MSNNGSVGSTVTISGARIAGVVACVPARVVDNQELTARFGDAVAQVTKMTGVIQRHIAAPDQTTADLCVAAAEVLLDKADVDRASIGAVIFISQTPDHRLPATACLLQDRLGLPTATAAFDVNLGCSAYPYGLWLASMMIASGGPQRVLLLVGDTISKIVHAEDRSTSLLFGDCGTATLIEADASVCATFLLGTDGSGGSNLIVPGGGFRTGTPADPRNPNPEDTLFMEGGEIFNFTLAAVPGLVDGLIEASGVAREDFDGFLFHQANGFMIKHLAKKAKLPSEKVPINIDRFGNTSSATIPLLLVTDYREQVVDGASAMLAMLGFGVGYSWAGCATRVGPLSAAELITA